MWKAETTRAGQQVISSLERCPIYQLQTDVMIYPADSIVTQVQFVHYCHPEQTGHLRQRANSQRGSQGSQGSQNQEESRTTVNIAIAPENLGVPLEHADLHEPDETDGETLRLYELRYAAEFNLRQINDRNRDDEEYVEDQDLEGCHFKGLVLEERRRIPNYKKSEFKHQTDTNKYYLLNIYNHYTDPAADPQD